MDDFPEDNGFDIFDEKRFPLTPMHRAARDNIAEQEALFTKLAEANQQPLEELARRIGISADEVAQALSGRTDLTLAELRVLAISAEVVVSFTVTPVEPAAQAPAESPTR
jgi:hypothetical protein